MAAVSVRRGVVTLALGIALSATVAGSDGELTEAQAKAGFLYNCALFVQWPATAASRELLVGIMGSDQIAAVADTMQGRRVNGRLLRVKVVVASDDLRQFQILFVGSGTHVKGAQLAALRYLPVLTVGESSDFTATGGVVRLYTADQRLRFEINMTRVEDAGLQVSAKMLGLATVVR